jgi:hypothetical protein
MIIEQANLGDFKIEDNYKTLVKRIKNFNKGFIRTKRIKLGNGEKTQFFEKLSGKMVSELYLIKDKYCVELGFSDIKKV